MIQPAQRPATYQDLLELPANLVGEIISGRLVTHPRPAPKHARAASILGVEIGGPFDKGSGGPGGWWILDEPEVHLGEHVLVPNLAGWRRERMPSLPQSAWFELSPDWVCEILSPATASSDRVEKLPIYAAFGVSHIWLIDPGLGILEAFESRDGGWFMLGGFEGQDRVSVAPFAAVGIELGLLWEN